MKVIDIIKPVCAYLGMYSDYITYFEPSLKNSQQQASLPNQIALEEVSNEDLSSTIDIPNEKKELQALLILAINNTQEKILKTMNLVTEEKVTFDNDKIEFSKLSKKLKRVINVSYKGRKLKFSLFDNYIRIYDLLNFDNILSVKYSYFLPYIENLQDDIPLETMVKERTFALGVASEYCYIAGLFDDAEIWNKKFLQELEEDNKNLKNFVTPKRSWR